MNGVVGIYTGVKKFSPLILFRINILNRHVLECLIESLIKSIGLIKMLQAYVQLYNISVNLWVIRCGQTVFDVQLFHQFFVELVIELFPLVSCYHLWQAHSH